MIETYDPRTKCQWYHRHSRLFKKQQIQLKILNDYAVELIENRRELMKAGQINGDECLADRYINVPVDGRMLPNAEIVPETNTITLGMSDTTQAAATFTIFHLAENTEVQRKVFEEVSAILEGDFERNITEKDCLQMVYLDAVIKEVLRMYPPISFIGRNLRSPITIGKYTFPEDVDIVISPYLMGRNPKYFDKPNEFNPDRFFGVDTLPPAFAAFGIGAKKCIGGKLSNLALKIAIAKVVMSFKFSLPLDHKPFTLFFMFTIKTIERVKVIFEQRVQKKLV